MAEAVDITLLAKVCQDNLAETKAMRRELADVQGLAIKTVDTLLKMEQRNEARFDAIEARFNAIDERFASIDDRFSSIDTRFASIDTRFASIDTHLAAIDSRFVAVDGRLRGIDHRMSDLKDELGLMIKRELMTALGSFETRIKGLIEERLAPRD